MSASTSMSAPARMTYNARYMSWFTSKRGVMSKGSYRRHSSPPSSMRFHTDLNPGSSHRSMLPQSMCGPRVNTLGPGLLMRNLSKYDTGVRTLTGVSGTEACQSERRYFWV